MANALTGNNPKWSRAFGLGLDRSLTKGGLMDGTIRIRFRNDELTQKSYLNIRVKYNNNGGDDTSYLCRIDDSFTSNSNISFAMQGFENNHPYYIEYINVKACRGYWNIPCVWCETNELIDMQYNSWNKNNKIEIPNGFEIHGLFNIPESRDKLYYSRLSRFDLNKHININDLETSITESATEWYSGKDNYLANITDELPNSTERVVHYLDNSNFNSGYYDRFYSLTGEDAMGSTQHRRGYSDRYLFAGQTTQTKVSPIQFEYQEINSNYF